MKEELRQEIFVHLDEVYDNTGALSVEQAIADSFDLTPDAAQEVVAAYRKARALPDVVERIVGEPPSVDGVGSVRFAAGDPMYVGPNVPTGFIRKKS